MISFKVLIILTFTINISHCEFSEEQIQIECKTCAALLYFTGFMYKLPFINYNIGMYFKNYNEMLGQKSEVGYFESKLNRQFNSDLLQNLQKKHGTSKLSKADIRSYANEYYNEIINYKPEITPMSPQNFCQEQFNQFNAYTKLIYSILGLTIKTIIKCEKNILNIFNYNVYQNVQMAYEINIKEAFLKIREDGGKKKGYKVLNSSTVEEDIKTLAPGINPNRKLTNSDQRNYYDYLLKYIEDNLTSMKIFDTQTWCNNHIPQFLEKPKSKV